MIGKIIIKGDIGSYEDELGNLIKGVDLLDVVAQVNDQRKLGALSFDVEVDSLGGFCDVGFAIHDFLKTIPENIKTIAVNNCASIATVIFLAGNQRQAHCPLMIHNPWISGVKGDADHLQQAADDIRAEEDKLIAFYSKYTGMEKIALDALMKQETYIYPDMAFKLGFTTELPTEKINTPVAYKAVAKIKENMSTEIKALSTKFDSFIKKMDDLWNGKEKAKALMVVEQGGKTLNITKADGSEVTGAPVAGDMVTIEGAPAPDGSYVITDMNATIEVAAGLIVSIMETPMDASVELANAKATIEALTKENTELKTASEESKKDVDSLSLKISEFEKTLSAMSGKVEIPEKKAMFRTVDANKGLADNLEVRRAELKAKAEAKNKK